MPIDPGECHGTGRSAPRGPGRASHAAALLAAGRAAEAAELLLADGGPDDDDGRILLAESLHFAGRSDDSIAAARDAVARVTPCAPVTPRATEAATATATATAASASARRFRAAAVLAIALVRRGRMEDLAEARMVLDAVTPATTDLASTPPELLHAEGVLRLRLGVLPAARVALLGAIPGFRARGDTRRAAAALDTLGSVHSRLGDSLRARGAYESSLAAKESLGDLVGQSITHGNLGRLALREGEPRRAAAHFGTSLALAERCGDAHGAVTAANGLGLAHTDLAEWDDAERRLRQALLAADRIGATRLQALCMKDLAVLDERRGRFDAAQAGAGAARRLFRACGIDDGEATCDLIEGRIELRTGNARAAASALARSVKRFREVRRPDLLAESLLRLAEATRESHADGAMRWIAEAEDLARRHVLPGVLDEARTIRSGAGAPAEDRIITLRTSSGLGGAPRAFQLLERLGSGGQGETWRAIDLRSAAPCVLKRCPSAQPDLSGVSATDRLLDEYATAARIDHPAVVRILGIERSGGDLWMAMEMLAGPDLRARLSEGPADVRTAVSWTVRIAEGLGALHDAGIVHRDVKPANLVLDSEGAPVLIDFGLALLDRAGAAAPDGVAGTLDYMAPEQATAQPLDGRADLFALGLVAAEIATGRNPVRDLLAGGPVEWSRVATLLAQEEVVRRLAGSIAWPAGTPTGFRVAVSHLLAPAPADRFPSAREFVAAVAAGG